MAPQFNHLSPFRRGLLVISLMIELALVGGCKSQKQTVQQKSSPASLSNAYSLALQQAKSNASSEELERNFKVNGRIPLSGRDIKSLSMLRVKQDSTILVLDNERKVAETYDPSGVYRTTIGGVGNGPGSQLWPSDVIEVANQLVAVSDFQGHRVNIFSKDGQFSSSFIYTPQNFSAQRMVYDSVNDCFFLFGNRWQTNGNGEILGADLLHKYASNGEFVASYFPFPEKAKALDLYSFNSPAIDVSDGVLYIALPFDYTVYQFDKSGEMKPLFQGANTSFKEPTVKLETEKIPREDAYNFVQTWRLGWTPILAMARIKDRLLVQYQTFDKLRYTIDVWSLTSRNIVKSIKTNHLMLTRGGDGYIYFLSNLETEVSRNMRSFSPYLSSKVISIKTIVSAAGLCLLAGLVGASYFRSAGNNPYSVRISAPDGSSSSIDLSVLEGVTLLNLGSGQREQISLRSSCNTFVIFLSAGDCPNCLKEREVWDGLATSYDPSRLRVIPILVNTSAQESKSFLQFLNLRTPVYYDESGQLPQKQVIPRETPFKALICKQGLLLAEGPNPKASGQAEFGNKVRATLHTCGD